MVSCSKQPKVLFGSNFMKVSALQNASIVVHSNVKYFTKVSLFQYKNWYEKFGIRDKQIDKHFQL